jgi:AmpD protein
MQINEGWLSSAKVVTSPNNDLRPDELDINLLIIHNISLPPGQFGGDYITKFFTNSLDANAHPYFYKIRNLKVSAHLLIERNGDITQFVQFNKRAWHAGVSAFEGRDYCNDYSIGIEMEGTDHEPYTHQQYSCLGQVSRCLMSYYPYISVERIIGHSAVAPDRKTDPGLAFDWNYFRSLL